MSTAVFAFGRMNPPTIGHKKLVDKVSSIPGDHFVFLSHASGNKTQKPGTKQYENKDPLPFSDKLAFVDISFPGVTVGHESVKTVMDAMKKLQADGYTDVVMVAGSDRVSDFTELLNKYQGVEYDFNTIEVISAGERDPDAEGADGMSASKMRAAVRAGDFESFKQGAASPQIAKPMFDMITKILKQNPMPGDAFNENKDLEMNEAKLNIKKIHKAVDDGKSMDVIVGMFADKGTTNTDEIRKIVKDYKFKNRIKSESKINEEEMCPDACCGVPVSECTCGPDCKHCDCYNQNKEKIGELVVDTSKKGKDVEYTTDPKLPNLRVKKKPSRFDRRSALYKMVPKMQKILASVKEMDLNKEQLHSVMSKASRLMIEIELAQKHHIVENLYSLNQDDVMKSEVLVKGVGRYSIEGLMKNINEKLSDLSNEASSMEPFDYKNIKTKIDSGIINVMLDSLVQAFDDLENARRKGGAASRSIPKNIFDDVMLQELEITQGTALKVLDNVASRADGKSFPIRLKDESGEIMVSPKLAKAIVDLYDSAGPKTKEIIKKQLSTAEGFRKTIATVKQRNRTLR